jgi:hypothetical protein
MPSRSDAQKAFVAALRDPQAPPPADLTGRYTETPARRFDVYRNNVHASLIDVLGARFPVIQRLVGESFFRAMARAFIATALPQSPVLIEYGGDFAAFVDGFPPAQSLPYLGDVGRLEWAWHEAYHAADRVPLDVERLSSWLQSNVPDDVARTRPVLHPSLRIVRSAWPVLEIWRTNTEDDEVQHVDLGAGRSDVLVVRPGWDVTLWPLPKAGADFVDHLTAGAPLGEAAEHAGGADAAFDLTANLQLLLAAGCIIGLSEQYNETSTAESL